MIVVLAVLAVLGSFAAALALIAGMASLGVWLADRAPLPTAWIDELELYANGVRR